MGQIIYPNEREPGQDWKRELGPFGTLEAAEFAADSGVPGVLTVEQDARGDWWVYRIEEESNDGR